MGSSVTSDNALNDISAAQSSPSTTRLTVESANVFVAGSLAVDLACDYDSQSESRLLPEMQTSNPAVIAQSLGGVGHNIARAAHYMGVKVQLCSAVGDDLVGKAAVEAVNDAGMLSSGIRTLSKESGCRTAQYVAFNDSNKDLVVAMADMSILEQPAKILPTFENLWIPQLQEYRPSHLVIDANWPPKLLAYWLRAAQNSAMHTTYEPVSTAKSTRIFDLPSDLELPVYPKASIQLATPNSHELAAMYAFARERNFFSRQDWWSVIDAFGIPHSGARTQLALATTPRLVDQGIPQQSLQLLPFVPVLCTKLGPQGVLLTQIIPDDDPRLADGAYAPYMLSRGEGKMNVGGVYMRLFPAVEEVLQQDVVSVNGVGDTFAGTLVAGLAKGATRVEDLIDLAQRAAILTLKSKESVSPGLKTLNALL